MLWLAATFSAFTAGAGPVSHHAYVEVRHLASAAEGDARLIRIAKDPRDQSLHLLRMDGRIYRLVLNAGAATSKLEVEYTAADHSAGAASGFAIGRDGTIFIVGNEDVSPGVTTRAKIMKGIPGPDGKRVWSALAETVPYPKSRTAYDHVFSGIVVSPAGDAIYVSSGSRTDHGEEQSNGGAFPGTREVALTACIFRLPVAGKSIALPNERPALQRDGYLFAEGLRNTFDMAFDADGNLFGTDNGPDSDMPEELNWLRSGRHYGFPWRIGGGANPQQFGHYDPAGDRLLHSRFNAVTQGYYHNDPAFPPPPSVEFTEPILNTGPDADRYRDAATGEIRDASDRGETLGTFTAHRSPLGLVFDAAGAMGGEFRHSGFVLSWTKGDAKGESVAGPFRDAGEDLLHLQLTQNSAAGFQARVTALVTGFSNPIDAEIVGNRLYVIEHGGGQDIWEITLPAAQSAR